MPSVRSSSTASSGTAGSINANSTPYVTLAAPAGLAVGDLLVVGEYFAQGTGTGISPISPPSMTLISPALTGTERTYFVFAAVVTASNLPTFQTEGIQVRAGASATRIAAVAVALTPDSGKRWNIDDIQVSPITYFGAAHTSATPPAISGTPADGYVTLNMAMTNKSANAVNTVHSSPQLIDQAQALGGASGSVADSVISVGQAVGTFSYNVSQANGQVITVRPVQSVIPIAADTRHVLRQPTTGDVNEYELYIYDNGALQETKSLGVLPLPKTVSQFHADIMTNKYPRMAHRNIGQTYPEMTIRGAFEAVVKHGAQALEFSARRTSDGVLIGSHDPTLTRATNGSGTISAMTYAQVKDFIVDVGGASLTPTPTVARMDDYMTWFKDYVLFLDNKDLTCWPEFFDVILETTPHALEHVVIKVDGAASPVHFQIPKQAGFKVMAYWFASSNFSNLDQKMPYVDYPGMAHDAPQSTWDLVRASADAQTLIDNVERPMWGHVLESEAEVTESISKGAKFVQCTRAVCFPTYTAW